MRRKVINSMMGFLVVVISLAGCYGGSGSSTTATTQTPTTVNHGSGTGAITAKLDWGSLSKITAKTVLSAPSGVATVRITVSGSGISPELQKDFTAATGTGTIDGIPAGAQRALTIKGLDLLGTVTYQGSALNITVQAGQTTNVGTITMNPIPVVNTGTAKERLSAFGFGQAVMINNNNAIKRDDIALSIPAISSRSTAIQFFHYAAAIGNVAIGYTSWPQDITVPPANPTKDYTYSATVDNINIYLDMAGTPHIDPTSDISTVYPNYPDSWYLNLGQPSTQTKMLAVFNRILTDVPTADGIFIDNIDPTAPVSFAYPEMLHSVLKSFKAARIAQGKEEPVIAGNFYSLRQHSANNYKVYKQDVFDAILVEDYGVKQGISDNAPADVIDFHKQFSKAVIIINTEVIDPNNPTATENTRAREAVTLAALVGGLHAIDRGTGKHGDNDYARLYLNFPVLRPGKPIADIVDTTVYYRRDYSKMIAVYAKQGGIIYLPPGSWHDYWDSNGPGAALPGSMNLTTGRSYLLFKD